MKQGSYFLILGLLAICNIAFAQSEKELEALKKQLAAQQEQLDKLTKDMSEKSESRLALSSHIEKLKIKGDLRLRYEYRTRDEFVDTPAPGRWVQDDRDRFRQRLRLDFTYDWEDNWLIHVGLATGSSDATSTNDTYSENSAFETGDIRLDFAYAKWSSEGHAVMLGQQKNPFVTSSMFWDGDVRPVGVTYQRDGNFFATIGAYDVIEGGSNESRAALYAVQGGVKYKGDVSGKVAIAYYAYSSPLAENAGFAATTDPDYTFDIVDFYADASMKTGDVKLGLYTQCAINLGAEGSPNDPINPTTGQVDDIDPDANNFAFIVGAKASSGKVSGEVFYALIEADSLYGGLKDGDFGDGALIPTDVEGYGFKLKYKLHDKITLGGTALIFERMESQVPVDGDRNDGEVYQVDLIYKF